MSDALQAFEVDGLILGTSGGYQFGLFVGDGLPHETVPEAPQHSLYFRSNGAVYGNRQTVSTGDDPGDWQPDPLAGGGVGHLPVTRADGGNALIVLEARYAEVLRAGGAVEQVRVI